MRSALPVLLAPLLALAACGTTPPVASPTPTVVASSVTPTPSPGASSASPSASASPSVEEGALVLRGDGLGAYSFGAKQADVTALLEEELGEPEESSQGVACELDDRSPWVQTVSWGSFWVQYAAKDAKKKSPRTLSSWGAMVGDGLPEPLVLDDDIPLDLTFAELEEAYPDGKTEDLGLGDGSKRFILPGKVFFVGSGEAPDRVQAGDFGVCE